MKLLGSLGGPSLLMWASLSLLIVADDFYNSESNPCPASCSGTPNSWSVYNEFGRMISCDQPILFDFAIHNPLEDPFTNAKLRACAVRSNGFVKDTDTPVSKATSSSTSSETQNLPTSTRISAVEKTVSMNLIELGSNSSSITDIIVVLQEVQNFLQSKDTSNSKLIFGYFRGAVVGVYSGAAVDSHASSSSIIQALLDKVQVKETTDIVLQLCGFGRNSDRIFGVVTGNADRFSNMKSTVRSWSDGKCASSSGVSTSLNHVSVWETTAEHPENNKPLFGRYLNPLSRLQLRSDCPTTDVASGDSCGSLATKCSISPTDFTKYNPDKDLCAKLQPGQKVCCGAGSLPDIRPKKNSNGTCSSHTVVADDNCSKLAAANGLNNTQIENFNNGTTWEWSGCSNIMVGTSICLSDGTPPMPAPVPNAVCGPTKPGTLPPTGTQKLADLSPCPLNVCCNVWGQCGIINTQANLSFIMGPEFCTEVLGPSKNPGTSPPGINGCVQNCGLNITNNEKGPETSISVGYYESWNWDRPCLHQRVKDLDAKAYTHMHWAFGTVNPDFTITVNDTFNQWLNFTSRSDTKKIISFGGWGVSTDPKTYDVLRQAMKPENVNKFTTQIVAFVIENILDGVDFDWEYPGAPDLPGIPKGLDSDGPNYLAFLQHLRELLPKSYSISIAAPSSYWYLKAFPIAEIAKKVNYIVYMTYDLHGQWDHGNKWSNPGCPNGNCLRSHVNLTETMYALSMITKAGVPTNKITVGVSSYGRSFGMSNAACTGPMCTFEGNMNTSTATEGECTKAAGILANAEINEIISSVPDNMISKYDDSSASDILVYNNQWVAYLSDNSKIARKDTYKKLNFAGTVDWAIDLQSFDLDTDKPLDDDPEGDADLEEEAYTGEPLPDCTGSYTTLEQLDKDADAIPGNCRALYAIQALDALLTSALASYTSIMAHGYDDKFNTYADSVVKSASKNVVDFYTGNGEEYFTCAVVEFQTCCLECRKHFPGKDDPQCRYCFDGGCKQKRDEPLSIDSGLKMSNHSETGLAIRESVPMIESAGKDKLVTKYTTIPEPCPPNYSLRGSKGPAYKDTVYWTLRPDRVTEFWAGLLNATGITPGNIAFKDVQNYPCTGIKKEDCINYGQWAMNVPTPQGYDKGDITNPKELVQKALSNAQHLGPQIKDLLLAIRTDSYQDGDELEAVDALGMPISMIADAVESMASVAEIGEEIKEADAKAKREKILFGFITAILIFVPVAGEVMSAVAGLATIGRVVALLGVAGNVAYDSYTIVKDPENAPLAIFGLILAPLGLADLVAIGKAAKLARGMDAKDAIKLGTNMGKRLATLQKVTKLCK